MAEAEYIRMSNSRDVIQSMYRELSLMSKEEFAEALEKIKNDPRYQICNMNCWNPPQYCIVKIPTLP